MKKLLIISLILGSLVITGIAFSNSLDINKIPASSTVREETKDADQSLKDFVITGLFPTFTKR